MVLFLSKGVDRPPLITIASWLLLCRVVNSFLPLLLLESSPCPNVCIPKLPVADLLYGCLTPTSLLSPFPYQEPPHTRGIKVLNRTRNVDAEPQRMAA